MLELDLYIFLPFFKPAVCNHSELLNDMERLRTECKAVEEQLANSQRETQRDVAKHKVKV